MRPEHEVSEAIKALGEGIHRIGLNSWQLRTLWAVENCRTQTMGGHIDRCDDCGALAISYNSCGNRHCPKCQGRKREEWIAAREVELLPVAYFHLVFTLPEAVNPLAIHNPKMVYSILFDAAWETLSAFGRNSGVMAGAVCILHTWGQNLSLHPHLHCIVPGGGVTKEGQWKNIRPDGEFLFPVRALSKVFRAKYCEKLRYAEPKQYERIRKSLWEKEWIVYAKKPFGGPKFVVEYLGRYSHKIAISNHRIKSVDQNEVSFEYKDYRQGGTKKRMNLSLSEFVRRFALHILPRGFVRIRHFGFLSSTWKRKKLPILRENIFALKTKNPEKGTFLPKCPCCKSGRMVIVLQFGRRGPPSKVLGTGQFGVPCEA
jgi:hypothetical protein